MMQIGGPGLTAFVPEALFSVLAQEHCVFTCVSTRVSLLVKHHKQAERAHVKRQES